MKLKYEFEIGWFDLDMEDNVVVEDCILEYEFEINWFFLDG